MFILLFKTSLSIWVLLDQSSMLSCGIMFFRLIDFIPHFGNIILSLKLLFSRFPYLSLLFSLLYILASLLDVGVLTLLLISHKDEASVSTVLPIIWLMLKTLSFQSSHY